MRAALRYVHSKQILHVLTYADNHAIPFFLRHGFRTQHYAGLSYNRYHWGIAHFNGSQLMQTTLQRAPTVEELANARREADAFEASVLAAEAAAGWNGAPNAPSANGGFPGGTTQRATAAAESSAVDNGPFVNSPTANGSSVGVNSDACDAAAPLPPLPIASASDGGLRPDCEACAGSSAMEVDVF
ncbi:hypothetical protein T492DRAFT_902622 [Pavlovales sp. CCMP2436]|nr:hypothetical protein T492DRAFT_902622 [Pavlovales sp. CCMP2436]